MPWGVGFGTSTGFPLPQLILQGCVSFFLKLEFLFRVFTDLWSVFGGQRQFLGKSRLNLENEVATARLQKA